MEANKPGAGRSVHLHSIAGAAWAEAGGGKAEGGCDCDRPHRAAVGKLGLIGIRNHRPGSTSGGGRPGRRNWRGGQMGRVRQLLCSLVWLGFSALAAASTYRGVVTFGGLPLPGATIMATQSAKTLTAISDQAGAFSFGDLADGKWTIAVTMQCFSRSTRQ